VDTYDTTQITDEVMSKRLGEAREYTLLLLKATPETYKPDSRPIIREHGRRNMALAADGVLAVVCPVTDGGDVAGIGIFDATAEEVEEIMAGDPAVQSGVLDFELHPVRGFPGAGLPA
jgi:hypothetical protein